MAAMFEAPAASAAAETDMPTERVAAQASELEPRTEPVWRMRTAHDIGSPRTRTGDVLLPEPADFESLLLSRPVLEGLRAAGFQRPSPVQLKAIPLGRCGFDLIVQAKSGTGKTCVFSTIALDSLVLENCSTQILILAPTREIAVQIHSVITAIGIKMEGLECHVFIGGTPLSQDKARLKKCHIAVGSPGRIKQLIELDYLNPGSIRLFILDEADKLLEEGSFQEQINWIYSSLPASKQMLAVSATYPEFLANALTRYMREPTFVRLNSSDPSLIGTLGLTVTYCCRGEEENMMMQIAQKCNINLLPLPDPIPLGLMEECLDGDVEVKTAVDANGLASVPAQPSKKQIQKIEKTFQTQKTNGNHMASSRNTSVSLLSVKSKHNTKQKLPVKSHSECGIIEKALSPKELGCAIKLKEQTNSIQASVQNSTNSQQQVKETSHVSLPKIPCLSSFKIHQPCTLSFVELVEDYEHYIKEGLEKPVEIIRHYTDPGDQTVNSQNGFVRNRVTEERVQILASSSQSGDSESDSDSYSSGTSSQSKGNKLYVEGSSDSQLKDSESTPVPGYISLEQPLNGSDTTNPEEYQESPEIQIKTRHKEGSNRRVKQSRRNLPEHSSYRSQPELWEDGWYQCHRETHPSFSDAYQDYEYWSAYYRAWQEYYAAASQSYYWNAQRNPNWMAAYHMNTVYLQEMMHGNQ
ncbi:Putative ATP-dependent RNA helicase DDX20 [Heterocephalus glaber]|uniref:RNA helicase n=1 Tax=Heterocephalus glaber TaxID=10181 RepID=G5BNX3_HETGA|nr:Putative ATP-dependent RNA helicase DDX20 [Heterocephalus glaber]